MGRWRVGIELVSVVCGFAEFGCFVDFCILFFEELLFFEVVKVF